MHDFTFADDTPAAWTYYRSTARWLFNASSGGDSPPVVPGREDGRLAWTPLPPPSVCRIGLSEALRARVSCRRFRTDSVPLGVLSTLLAAGYGIGDGEGAVQDRPVPSGGGLYPLELSLLVRAVDGIPAGVHHYVPAAHGLELVRAVELPRAFLTYLFMGQPWVAEAALICVISFVGERSLTKYGDRGYRYALLEAGHLTQNLNLTASALGLGAVNMGGFYDDELATLAGIDIEHEIPLYCSALGIPDADPSDRMAMRALERGVRPS
ncbi:SagB/ThcOx family dehydrogenase [Micropruina sp.]|uniref:SagB/ThcOx family dehydrogenase n=1 Tax=Micropruina sp. TaxID=2737536 RepID=UPI002608C557|nr:SagB/ThcOx family dehydrogenase [Micropruina sp.]